MYHLVSILKLTYSIPVFLALTWNSDSRVISDVRYKMLVLSL